MIIVLVSLLAAVWSSLSARLAVLSEPGHDLTRDQVFEVAAKMSNENVSFYLYEPQQLNDGKNPFRDFTALCKLLEKPLHGILFISRAGSPALPKVADFAETMGLPLITPFAGRIKDSTTTVSFLPVKSEKAEEQIFAFLKSQITDLRETIIWACEKANVVPVARVFQLNKDKTVQPMVMYFDKKRIADEIARTLALYDRGSRRIICICGGPIINEMILVAQVTGLFKRNINILFLDPTSDQASGYKAAH